MRYWKLGAALFALALATVGCGATTHNREDDSGNTNWLKACESDAECGELSCLCGSCRTACGAATDCSAEPADSCVGLPTHLLPTSSPQTLREHRDLDAQAVDLALGQDGSVTLAGGKGATALDLTTIYFNFWVTKLSPEAEELWTYEELQDTPDPARSVALTVGGETVALSTVYDGHDTPLLRRIDENGELIGSRRSTPGFTTIREDGRGGFFASGSNWANDVPNALGRTPTVAWVGLFDPPSVPGSETPHWQQERYDLVGGISNLLVASSDGRGNLVVGGSLGTAEDSNASQPYLARLNHPGEVVWELSVPTAEVTHCDATAVAMFPSGSSLAAIGCGPRWVRAFQPSGRVIWERRFAYGVTALLGLEDGGYVVAVGGGTAVLERYDASHRLVWLAQQEGCTAFTRLAVSNGAVVALAECQPGYSLSWYADP